MKIRLWLGAAMLAGVFAGQAEAATTPVGDFSATLSAKSEYNFRGISQSDEDPALQGSLDWQHPRGFYAGAWASNVDFDDGGDADIETDIYGGYRFNYTGIAMDVGLIGYLYPGADSAFDYDYWEARAAASHDIGPVAMTAAINYTPGNFRDSDDATYAALAGSAPIRDTGFSVTGSLGHRWIDDEAAFGAEDYADWSAGVGYDWNGFGFALKYVDTSMDDNACADGCDARGIFSVSRTFE